MRQEIGHLAQQIRAQGVIADANMDVHPTDQHSLGDAGQITLKRVVAVAFRVGLLFPIGKRMAGGGNRGDAEPACMLRNDAAQALQIIPRFFDGAANPGADLDLAPEEFRADMVSELCPAGVEERIGRLDQSARPGIDKKVLLLDSDRELRFFHTGLPGLIGRFTSAVPTFHSAILNPE